jgi:hypothetical protein
MTMLIIGYLSLVLACLTVSAFVLYKSGRVKLRYYDYTQALLYSIIPIVNVCFLFLFLKYLLIQILESHDN